MHTHTSTHINLLKAQLVAFLDVEPEFTIFSLTCMCNEDAVFHPTNMYLLFQLGLVQGCAAIVGLAQTVKYLLLRCFSLKSAHAHLT